MKLRIRAASGGATFRVEVPAICSLRTLRETISQILVSNGVSFFSPIRISLNKSDEMQGLDSTLLSQFGVRGGDLLYYFDSQGLGNPMYAGTGAGGSPAERCDDRIALRGRGRVFVDSAGTAEAMEIVPQEGRGAACLDDRDTASARRELCAAAATKRASLAGCSSTDSVTAIYPSSTEDVSASVGDSSHDGGSATTASHIDAKNSSEDPLMAVGSGIQISSTEAFDSIPIILQRVLEAEFRHVSDFDVLLILAVHAAMLETGFIVWNASAEGNGFPGGWFRRGTADLQYTLPEIVQGVGASDAGHAILKCLTVGQHVVIYGTTSCGNPPPIYRLNLQISKYLVGREGRKILDPAAAKNNVISSFSDLFGLWKVVKDDLSLPLLTVLCERAGLPVPPSLLRIPVELKMKILECLPALDLARLGCTCSELRHLSANDDLWKELFSKEFGSVSRGQTPPGSRGWKDAFQQRFMDRKRAFERVGQRRKPYYGISSRFRPYHGFPRIIGGDYDIFPNLGNTPFRGGLGGPRGSLGSLHGRLYG